MALGVSSSGRKRDEYMRRWPQGKQNEAMGDQIKAISDAMRAYGVPLVDAPKFEAMLADFDAVRSEVDGV